jgi:hypothetical protein
MQMTAKEIKNRLTELESLIRETKERLPAHSTKPPIMLELLAYEDEYEALMTDLNRILHQEK